MNGFLGYIVTAILSLLVGFVLQRLRDRPKLLYWVPGSFLFELSKPQNILLRTDSLTIQNVGRESASNVEIIHKTRPDHFQFATPIAYAEEVSPSGEHIIKIPSLGAKEHVNIQYLSYTAAPFLLQVRSESGSAQPIQVHLQRLIPRSIQIAAGGLLLLGIGFALYWLVTAIVFISRSIGVV